jgi:hypothetical protein
LLADQGLKVEQIYNKNFNNQEEQNLYFHLLSLSVNEVIEKWNKSLVNEKGEGVWWLI